MNLTGLIFFAQALVIGTAAKVDPRSITIFPEINPCFSGYHRCLNGATCIPDKIGLGYFCQCTNCYGGDFCEFAKPVFNPCFGDPDSNPCLNGGKCDFTDCTFSCKCQPGYSGRTCEFVTCPKQKPCLAECPYGFATDAMGCQTCKCLPKPQRCPPRVAIAKCIVDPCDNAKCPANPDATCIANYCGGCNAVFYGAYGNEVKCSVECYLIKCAYPCPFGTEVTSDGCPTCRCLPNPAPCPDGNSPSLCKRNPCDGTICEVNPMTSCVPNYCGGCFVDFYDRNLNIDLECLETNCRGDLVFNQCASACPQTCDNPDIQCKALCRPGCACPKGTILTRPHSLKCVRPWRCPNNCKGFQGYLGKCLG